MTGQPTLTPEKPPPFQPWTPSEEIIKDIGKLHGAPLELGDNAPQWAKTTESVLPWLIPTGNQISRVGEAPGVFNKVMTVGRSELGNAASWFISNDIRGDGRPTMAIHGGGAAARHCRLRGAGHGASAAGGWRSTTIVAGVRRDFDENGLVVAVNLLVEKCRARAEVESVTEYNSSFVKLSSGFLRVFLRQHRQKGALGCPESDRRHCSRRQPAAINELHDACQCLKKRQPRKRNRPTRLIFS